jgi:hypothetical protein
VVDESRLWKNGAVKTGIEGEMTVGNPFYDQMDPYDADDGRQYLYHKWNRK